MNVLIIKNVFSEGPGTIADHLAAESIPSTVVELSINEAVPDIAPFSHLLIMGGPMAVYEMHKHTYLAREAQLIELAIKKNMHVLGVCLGAQMLAHVLGGRVYAGGAKEIGWYEVALTPDGMQDPAMSGLAVPGRSAAQVFQWHGDTFDLPDNAVRLASSDLFPNQAFRHSDRVYALQFHIEVTPGIVREWLKNEQGIELAAVDARSTAIYTAYRDRASRFYRSFFSPR